MILWKLVKYRALAKVAHRLIQQVRANRAAKAPKRYAR